MARLKPPHAVEIERSCPNSSMSSKIKDFVTSSKGRPLAPSGGKTRIYTGSPHPFGATVDDEGVNFSVYSANATAIQLLIFDNPSDLEPTQVIDLSPVTNKSFFIWHIYVEGLRPGSGYAYRVDGPNEPWNGHRFNPAKVLIDPYSKGNSLALWERGAACGGGVVEEAGGWGGPGAGGGGVAGVPGDSRGV